MADEQEPHDTVEAARLEIDRARLALDTAAYQNDQTRIYLERWRVDVQSVHEMAERSREMANGYAKAAIQIMFLLNGGALIAFPAFAGLVGTGFRDHVGWALASIGAFVAGLVLVGVATLLAYMSMDADAEAIRQREEYVKAGLNRSLAPDEEKPEHDKIRENAEAARKRFYGRAIRLRNADADGELLEQIAAPDAAGRTLLTEAAERLRLTARGYHRTLRVARTLADLDGAGAVARRHIAEALAYRRVMPGR